MPVYRQRTILELARGVRTFLNLDLGLTRGEVPELEPSVPQKRRPERFQPGGIRAENMVWIFGSGRSGGTWLRAMMAEMENYLVWEEPRVGLLFGDFHSKAQRGQLGSKNFIMSDPTRDKWMRSVRSFVLDGVRYAHPEAGAEHYLIIKELAGSIGAPILMEALPESRMIFLVRDPRDVAALAVDSSRKGSSTYPGRGTGPQNRTARTVGVPEDVVKTVSGRYAQYVGSSKLAYDSHEGPKVMIRYEDLRADTLGEMKRIYSALNIPADESEFARVVEEYSVENVSEVERDRDEFRGEEFSEIWREGLTPEQVEIVEEVTAPLLSTFYAT